MSSINELSLRINTRTLNFVLLSVVTCGIYPLLWLYRKQNIISETTGVPFASDLYVLWMAVCFGLSRQFATMGTTDPEMYGYDSVADMFAMLSGVLSIACAVMYVIWAFKARTALRQYALNTFRFDLKMNAFYTVIFNVYYVNYCINDMQQALAKHQIIHGAHTATPPAAAPEIQAAPAQDKPGTPE